MKRGQITIYIIIGMMILILSALAVYLALSGRTEKQPPIYILEKDTEPVRIYVESCLKYASRPYIYKIAEEGGRLDPQQARYYMGKKMQYLCLSQEELGCVNTLLTREEMENQIASAVITPLRECINLEIFEKQGFTITQGDMDAHVKIGLDTVHISLDYPLMLRRENTTLMIDSFSYDWNLPLGRLYVLATNIVNQENTQGFFDAVNWTVQNDAEILIQKHRPYPDIVYSLTEDNYTFNFAIQGEISRPAYGCCYIPYDNNCYKNVPRILCEQKKGVFDPDSRCVCPSLDKSKKTTCNGKACKDCDVTYDHATKSFTGKKRKHGESWCGYDAEDNYVGSRHYLHYCIDGREYVEECADFRKEICAETTMDNISEATCRPNRWEDCAECNTEDCCLMEEYRDCIWENNRCFPAVPPGSRFWEDENAGTCALAGTEKQCQGFTCGDIWATGSARQCYKAGDCGNYRNYIGILTEDGFIHTDIQANVDQSIYLPEKRPEFRPDYRKSMDYDYHAAESADQISRLIRSVYSFLESLSNLQVSEYYNDDYNNTATSASVFNIGICSVWSPPDDGSQCSRCDDDPLYPCTEYRCMSLGSRCTYEERKGIPGCLAVSDNDIIPAISLGEVSPGYAYEKKTIDIAGKHISGVVLDEKIRPHSLLKISLDTTEDTTCRMSYLPIRQGTVIRGYGSTHNLSIRIPPRPEFPKKLLDLMNASDSEEFSDLLFQARKTMMEMEDKESALAKIYGSIFGESFFSSGKKKLSGLVELLTSDLPEYKEAFKKISKKFEQGGYYIFFTCKDRTGNTSEPFFIEITIADNIDEDPPILLGTIPENSTSFGYHAEKIKFTAYLDEPSECNITTGDSFRSMDTCSADIFDLNPEYGGSYTCTTELNTTEMMHILLRCLDNPADAEEFRFNITLNPANITANITADKSDRSFVVNASNVTVSYYMDIRSGCRASYTPGIRPNTYCTVSDNPLLGQYMCMFSINGSNRTEEKVVSLLCSKELEKRNLAQFSIDLSRSKELVVIDSSPKGEVSTPYLNITLSESKGTSCAYYKELGLSDTPMKRYGNSFYAVPHDASHGDNTYYIACADSYGNSLTQKIYFYLS